MVLGANLFIGGSTQKQFVITNNAQIFYATRLEIEPVTEWLTLGGVFSANHHDDVMFNSGRAVLDIKRRSVAADAMLNIPESGIRCSGAYGAGKILDDWTTITNMILCIRDGKPNGVRLNPLLKKLDENSAWDDHGVEIGARFEDYVTESDESGEPRTEEPGRLVPPTISNKPSKYSSMCFCTEPKNPTKKIWMMMPRF